MSSPSRQEKPRATGGGASPENEAARQLRQVSSSWTLLLQPVAANTRAPPASVPLLRCSAAPFPGSCETLPGTQRKTAATAVQSRDSRQRPGWSGRGRTGGACGPSPKWVKWEKNSLLPHK